MSGTPNMNMTLPTEGGSANIWATILDQTAFLIIDSHNHAPGNGVLVPTTGLGINADLTFAAFGATNLKLTAFSEVAAAAVSAYVDAIFVNSSDHNLYFRNAAGVNVQITSGNSLNLSAFGGIGGDYSTVGALLSYVDADKDYLLQQEGSPRPWAGIRTGDVQIYQKAASITNAVTIKSPNSLAAGYTLTMPTAPAGAQSTLQSDASGNLSFVATTPVHTVIFHPFASSGGTIDPTTGYLALGTATAAYYRIELPIGKTLTGFTVNINKTASTGGCTVTAQLNRTLNGNSGANAIGGTLSTGVISTVNTYTLVSPGVSQVMAANQVYFVSITATTATGVSLAGCEVTYSD